MTSGWTRVSVAVELNFDSSTSTRADLTGNNRELASRIDELLTRLLAWIGLDGVTVVEIVEPQRTRRAIRIRVNGKLVAYPADALERAWLVCAPPDYRGLADQVLPREGFPDGWLRTELPRIAAKPGELPWLREFISQLVVNVVHDRPALLVELETLMPRADLENGARAGALRRLQVARALADLGLSLNNKRGLEATDSDEEKLFARFRPRRIELHAHPDYAARLLASIGGQADAEADSQREQPFEQLRARLLQRWGVRVPELVWVPSATMAPGLVAVRINEALGPAMRCLGAGEKLELVLSSVEAELWRLRWRLLSQDDVEYELALLYDEAPELIHQVLDRYTLGALTRVLRALLRAGIVLCDLRSILEALMAYAGDTDDVVECVAFVRQRLSSEGIFALMGDSERPLHEIAVSLSGPVDSLTEEEVEALRDGVASELTQSSTSVIVAPLEQREAVRLLLEDELPEVFVVSPGEVPPYPVSHAPGACPSVP